ncbi:MAG: S24/S26 family peptidase [Rikenellaceae bacterium]|nr:S24/S26 family peptidase [Rikenellaceae bacterium]
MKINNELFFAEIETLLSEGLKAEFMLLGNSMRPLLRNGRDTVIIAPTTEQDPLVGEVYLFRYRGRHMLHRLHRIEGEILVMRGDGNYRIEERCRAKDLVGRLVCVRCKSGREIDCSGRAWRLKSRLWCALPAELRRIILGVLRRTIGL